MTSIDATTDDRSALRANCGNCFALCCTAFGFQKSADFPIDKPAGTPCLNLTDQFSCSIHDSLRGRGFRGCTVFDCFGAGQYVSQNLFGGTSWRERPETSAEMFGTFAVVRQLNEMLWYLVEAAERATTSELSTPVTELRSEIMRALDGDASEIRATDVEHIRAEVRQALIEVSEEARGGYATNAEADMHDDLHPSADLVGRDLRSIRLCGADLRGAYLIAADFRRVDLAGVDLLGADLRDARLEGADLSTRCSSHNHKPMQLAETPLPCCRLPSAGRSTGSPRSQDASSFVRKTKVKRSAVSSSVAVDMIRL